MASRASPSGEGPDKRADAIWRAGLYTGGSVAGGALLGACFGLLGRGLGALPWVVIAAAVAFAAVIAEARKKRISRGCWQIPRSWFGRLGMLALLPAAFVLSLGFLTPVWFSTYYAMVVLFAASGLPAAAGVGAIYGLARSLSSWRRALGPPTKGVTDPASIVRSYRNSRLIVQAALIAVFLFAVAD